MMVEESGGLEASRNRSDSAALLTQNRSRVDKKARSHTRVYYYEHSLEFGCMWLHPCLVICMEAS